MWQIAAVLAVAVLAVIGLLWVFAGRWVHSEGSGKVAKDDKAEAEATIAEQRRVLKVLSQPTPKGKELRDMLEKRRKRRKAKP